MVIDHLLSGMILQVQSPTDHHLHAIAFGEGEDLVEVRLIPRQREVPLAAPAFLSGRLGAVACRSVKTLVQRIRFGFKKNGVISFYGAK